MREEVKFGNPKSVPAPNSRCLKRRLPLTFCKHGVWAHRVPRRIAAGPARLQLMHLSILRDFLDLEFRSLDSTRQPPQVSPSLRTGRGFDLARCSHRV